MEYQGHCRLTSKLAALFRHNGSGSHVLTSRISRYGNDVEALKTEHTNDTCPMVPIRVSRCCTASRGRIHSHSTKSEDDNETNLLLSGKLKRQNDLERDDKNGDICYDVESCVDKPESEEVHAGAFNGLVPKVRCRDTEKERRDGRVKEVANDQTQHNVTC